MSERPPTRPGPIAPPKKSRAWIVFVVVGGVVALLAVVAAAGLVMLLLPSVSTARAAAARARSQVQLRQIAVALDVYASDNGGAFPADAAAWRGALVERGLVPAEVFAAPQASPGMVSYYYVPGWTREDGDQVLVYENPALYDAAGGDGGGTTTAAVVSGGHVVLVDGTVEWIEGPAFLARIDAIRLRDGTVYAPHREDD